MDFDKIFQLIKDHLSDYFSVLTSTLIKPKLQFLPEEKKTEKTLIFNEGKSHLPVNQRINSHLFEFAFISIFIGSTLQVLLPGNTKGQNITITLLLPFIAWFIIGTLIYLLSRMLKGRGTYTETVSVCLQIFSAVYIIGSILTFLWGIITILIDQYHNLPNPEELMGEITLPFYVLPPYKNYQLLLTYPVLLYFIIYPILLLIYLSWSVILLHGFKKYKTVIVFLAISLILLLFSISNTVIYQNYSVIVSPAR